MTTMLFYQSVKALNRDLHSNLRLEKKENPFAFAAKTNSVLLAASEFVEAGRDFPIVFVGAEKGPFSAAALVGLRDNENLFVTDNGDWVSHSYVPAFVRRYPFVLAENGEQLTVCIDETYEGLNEKHGIQLFEKDAQESSFLKEVLEFLQSFHADMQRTRIFGDKLAELGLLMPKSISFQENDHKRVLDGLWVVDEEKLAALSDAEIVALHRNGYLSAIYAHLFSLGNINRLAQRAVAAHPEMDGNDALIKNADVTEKGKSAPAAG